MVIVLLAFSFSAASALPDAWTVLAGDNAVPGAVPGHSVLHSSVATAQECQASCEANSTCLQFTWNKVLAPHHCFWGFDATWAPVHNAHVVSGCLSSGERASAGCPPPPAPTPPTPPTPPPLQPSWVGPIPDPAVNASAGMPLVPRASHATVYNATLPDGKTANPFGTYNHGPILTHFDGLFWMSWYNSPVDESTNMRSVYATSADGAAWSAPQVLFPNLTHNGEENGPWTIINGRLYTQSGDQDAGKHIESIVGMMRRVTRGGGLGEPFWLNETVPSCCASFGFKTYLQMDETTRADAAQFLASAVRTLVGVPNEMAYNERSLYLLPGTRTLVVLLRGAAPKSLTSATCHLPPLAGGAAPEYETGLSCRPGVGDVFYNLVEMARPNGTLHAEPRTCNWTTPVVSSVPDSHSRTCAAAFPASGDIYLVGNQVVKGRDPVTLAVAKDGLIFDQHWAVRAGAPPVKYPGHAKGPGFQYPGACVVGGDEMFVSYSLGKEDIGLTRFPLSAIGQKA
jgi:hypothetical protein